MEDEASVNRLIRKRTANRTVLKNLLNQGHGIVNNVEDKKEACNVLESLINVIENKFQIIKNQDLEIIDVIHEDLIEQDTARATEFELDVEKGKRVINNFLEENCRNKKSSVSSFNSVDSLNVSSKTKPSVRLPKISMKKFSGDPLK